MREQHHLPHTALNEIISWTATICQDSVLLAGNRVQKKLENTSPAIDCDISDCLDLADHHPFRDAHSDWLRNQYIKKHFHLVVCTLTGFKIIILFLQLAIISVVGLFS